LNEIDVVLTFDIEGLELEVLQALADAAEDVAVEKLGSGLTDKIM